MQNQNNKKRPIKPSFKDDFRHRHGKDEDAIHAEAGIGIMKHKDGTMEKRKF